MLIYTNQFFISCTVTSRLQTSYKVQHDCFLVLFISCQQVITDRLGKNEELILLLLCNTFFLLHVCGTLVSLAQFFNFILIAVGESSFSVPAQPV